MTIKPVIFGKHSISSIVVSFGFAEYELAAPVKVVALPHPEKSKVPV